MFDIKSFYEAKDVADAINALVKNPDAEIISGGTDVLIRVREGKDAAVGFIYWSGLGIVIDVRLQCSDFNHPLFISLNDFGQFSKSLAQTFCQCRQFFIVTDSFFFQKANGTGSFLAVIFLRPAFITC